MEKLASEVQVGEVIQALDRNFRVESISTNREGYITFSGKSLTHESDFFKVKPTRVIPIIEGNSDLENAKESARLYFENLKFN